MITSILIQISSHGQSKSLSQRFGVDRMLRCEGYDGRISGTMRDCNEERNAEFLALVLKSRSNYLGPSGKKLSLIGCVIESRVCHRISKWHGVAGTRRSLGTLRLVSHVMKPPSGAGLLAYQVS